LCLVKAQTERRRSRGWKDQQRLRFRMGTKVPKPRKKQKMYKL